MERKGFLPKQMLPDAGTILITLLVIGYTYMQGFSWFLLPFYILLSGYYFILLLLMFKKRKKNNSTSN